MNNPFRSKPSSNLQQNVEDWGKTKFKPIKSGDGTKNSLKTNSATGGKIPSSRILNIRKGNKETYKFNEEAGNAKPENATPWSKYKDEIIYKQREEQQAFRQDNVESNEIKAAIKQREINYRKSLIAQKMQEHTKWENFDEDQDYQKKTISPDKNIQSHINETTENCRKKRFNKNHTNVENNMNIKSSKKFKRNMSTSNLKSNKREIISKELLDNFDSKKLSYKQNEVLRGTITKMTILSSGSSLEKAVNNIKRKKLKKEKLNKN